MAVHHEQPRRHLGLRMPSWHSESTTAEAAAESTAVTTTAAARAVAVLRIATGFVFLWAFLDKTFGWGYATASERAWVNGGSPTEGFLSHVAVGPMESTFHQWAGAAWADWLFMLGLLAIGVALVGGVALRLAALAGTVMMVLMWAAEWPLAQHLSDGSPSMSTNPVVDYHIIYAVVIIALAAVHAGHTWGLGKMWAKLPFVRHNRWLL